MNSKLGSNIAKNGFNNEKDIVNKFNNWDNDKEAQKWLCIMKYKIENIKYVKATVINGHKTDIRVQIQIKSKSTIDVENIQIKLVSNKSGFNQIDKRYLKSYDEMWKIPNDVYKILQYFTGELSPYKSEIRDSRRMFLTEMKRQERNVLVSWIKQNRIMIVSDILKGRGEFSAEWMLVVQKINNETKWILKNINEVLNFYGSEEITITKLGSIKLGKITIQRKGGDGGRITANMLQFKINPMELFV